MTSKPDNIYLKWNKRQKGNQILVINSGSSSVKLTIFENQVPIQRLIDVNIKGITSINPKLTFDSSRGTEKTILNTTMGIPEALDLIFRILSEKFDIQIHSLLGIGHRFVHGGSQFVQSCRFSPSMLPDLEKLLPLAPLHNAACLSGIQACDKINPAIPQVIVFDTAFHSNMPALAANYAIPCQLAEKHQIKRYGFHGIAHGYLWKAYAALRGTTAKNAKIITLQLGNGCSIAAIDGGRSMDTSMGFSPAEGLVMATRAGDIDAAVMEYLCRQEGTSADEVMDILNEQSGLKGLSGSSSDMESLLKQYPENENARLAIDLFCYRIVKYLGAYTAALGGTEAVLFSGGIGENAASIRANIISKMSWCGWQIDSHANQAAVGLKAGSIEKISADASTIGLYVVPADENICIAEKVRRFL